MGTQELPRLRADVTELGAPGPMRERLVAAVLRGDKTATTCLRVLYDLAGEEPPAPGQHSTLVNSAGEPVAQIEYTAVTTTRLGDVGLGVAAAEGEGFSTVEEWRSVHEAFWGRFRDAVRAGLGDPVWDLDDDVPVVVEWFRVAPPSGAQ